MRSCDQTRNSNRPFPWGLEPRGGRSDQATRVLGRATQASPGLASQQRAGIHTLSLHLCSPTSHWSSHWLNPQSPEGSKPGACSWQQSGVHSQSMAGTLETQWLGHSEKRRCHSQIDISQFSSVQSLSRVRLFATIWSSNSRYTQQNWKQALKQIFVCPCSQHCYSQQPKSRHNPRFHQRWMDKQIAVEC